MINQEDDTVQQWNLSVDETYSLRLFVAGASSVSVRAIANLRLILEDKLKGKYELEIIDIHQQALLVKEENVIAVPLLIKKRPGPIKRLVGDMSNQDKVIKGLGLS